MAGAAAWRCVGRWPVLCCCCWLMWAANSCWKCCCTAWVDPGARGLRKAHHCAGWRAHASVLMGLMLIPDHNDCLPNRGEPLMKKLLVMLASALTFACGAAFA